MSRLYDAIRRSAEERKTAPAAAAGAAVADECFPTEPGFAPESTPAKPKAKVPAARPIPAPPAKPPAGSSSARAGGNGEQTFVAVEAPYDGKKVIDASASPRSREEYRRLAAILHHAQESRKLKVVMLTSALVSEGKTLTSSNVALTLSQSYKKQVLLIDADLRRPSLQTVFGIIPTSGLGDRLIAPEERPAPVHQLLPGLSVLAAGRPCSDPIAALTSERMRRLIQHARDTFDWVILDTPPVTVLTDANLLCSMVDGVIIVVRAGSTPWDLVQRAVQAIGRERTLGIVLNRATVSAHSSRYYDDYYYYEADRKRSTRR